MDMCNLTCWPGGPWRDAWGRNVFGVKIIQFTHNRGGRRDYVGDTRAYSNDDVCTWGTRMGPRCNGGGRNGGERTVCRLMHNSRFESIDTSSLSIAHEYETNATPVTYGVFPRSWRFFLTICLVSLNSKKSGARKNERRAKDDRNFSRVPQLLDVKKQREYIATKFQITWLEKIFEECFAPAGRSFLTSSLSFICNFLLEKFF